MYNPDVHHRRSIRLPDFDYSSAGAYYITICVHGRECLFGKIEGEGICLNDAGRVVERLWAELPQRFAGVELDAYVVMPNHIHGIVTIDQVGAPLASPGIRAPLAAPSSSDSGEKQGAASSAPTLGTMVRAFKSLSAIKINRELGRQGRPLWQRNYFERIIRSEAELTQARAYIRDNPARWSADRENPVNIP